MTTVTCCDNYEVNEYLKMISKYKHLSNEEELALGKQIKLGSEDAKMMIVQSNLKNVVIIAKKIVHKSNVPMMDLIQEGNLGLMVAVEKFNWDYGTKFITYATWWIRQAIFKAISEQSNSMKIPVYVQETLSKFSKVKTEFSLTADKLRLQKATKVLKEARCWFNLENSGFMPAMMESMPLAMRILRVT